MTYIQMSLECPFSVAYSAYQIYKYDLEKHWSSQCSDISYDHTFITILAIVTFNNDIFLNSNTFFQSMIEKRNTGLGHNIVSTTYTFLVHNTSNKLFP